MKHKIRIFYFLVFSVCFIFAGSKKHQHKAKHHDKLRTTIHRHRYLQDVKKPLNVRQRTSPSIRSLNRHADLDDGEEHNVTVIYDRVNGLTDHHHHNQKNQKHKQTFIRRKGSKDSVKASKRQYMPLSMDQDSMYGGGRPSSPLTTLFTPSSDIDERDTGGAVDGGLLPIGPVGKVLSSNIPSGNMLSHAGFEEDVNSNVPSYLGSIGQGNYNYLVTLVSS
jgi:hypothetical protein